VKKLCTSLFTIAVVLLFVANVYAGPSLLQIEYRGFSEFNELRYMADNANDEQLYEFLSRTSHHRAGITDRESAQMLVDSLGRALIPALPNSESVKWSITVPFGDTHFPKN